MERQELINAGRIAAYRASSRAVYSHVDGWIYYRFGGRWLNALQIGELVRERGTN